MLKIHERQIHFDRATAEGLIRSQWVDYSGDEIVLLPNSGTDHVLAKIGKTRVARFPIIEWAQHQARNDQRWLPFFGRHLPFRVPQQLFLGHSDTSFPFEWSICDWIEGEPIDPDQRQNSLDLVKDFENLLRSLQRLPVENGPDAERLNLRGRSLRTKDAQTRESLAKLPNDVDQKMLTKIWGDVVSGADFVSGRTWFHGDLLSGNVLFLNGRINGVIDFGGPGVGDWACDLIGAWHILRKDERRQLRKSMEVSRVDWLRGIGHTISQAVIYIPYYEMTFPTVCNKMKVVLRNIVEEHFEDAETANI